MKITRHAQQRMEERLNVKGAKAQRKHLEKVMANQGNLFVRLCNKTKILAQINLCSIFHLANTKQIS